MDIRTEEIINIVLVLLLMLVLLRDNKTISFILFVYASLHFSYASIPLFAGAQINEMLGIHLTGSGILAEISGALFIVASTLILIHRAIRTPNYIDRELYLVFGAVFFMVVVGYITNIRLDDGLQLKNIVGTGSMLILMLLLSQGQEGCASWVKQARVMIVMLMLAGMLGVAFYEVYSLRTWSPFGDSYGEIIYRASSLLFNPNLYGVWCALIALGFAYLFHQQIGDKWLAVAAMAMAFAGIYFSGSRSAGFLLLVTLAGIALSISEQALYRRWFPIVLMFIVFVVLGTASGLLESMFPEQYNNWHAIKVLGWRFAVYPMQLGDFLLSRLNLSDYAVPHEIAVSIEGRYTGGLRDAGWLVLYDDAGWIGIIAILGLWGILGVWGIRTYVNQPSVASIYALAILVFSVAVGVVMRFQAFPTGLFMSLALAPCIAYWRARPEDNHIRSCRDSGKFAAQ